MILTNAKYEEALRLLQGEARPSELLQSFRAQMKEELGVDILDIEYKGRPGLKRLNVLFRRHEDMHRIGACGSDGDEAIRSKMTEAFRRLCVEMAVEDYSADEKIVISFGDMETEMRSKVLEKAQPLLAEVPKLFPAADLSRIYAVQNCVHIFFSVESAAAAAERDGTAEAVRDYCRNAVTSCDELQVFPEGVQCVITSEERLNADFGGNIFNYFSGMPIHA